MCQGRVLLDSNSSRHDWDFVMGICYSGVSVRPPLPRIISVQCFICNSLFVSLLLAILKLVLEEANTYMFIIAYNNVGLYFFKHNISFLNCVKKMCSLIIRYPR